MIKKLPIFFDVLNLDPSHSLIWPVFMACSAMADVV